MLIENGAQDGVLEDRPFLHQAQEPRNGRARRLSKNPDTSSFNEAGRARLRRRPCRRHRAPSDARPQSGQEAIGPAQVPAQDLAVADHVASKCADEEEIRRRREESSPKFEARGRKGGEIIGQKIRDIVTVNGVRVTAEDGTWGLIRASSNKPELVVVVESPTSDENKKKMFDELDAVLRAHPEVGEYNQKI